MSKPTVKDYLLFSGLVVIIVLLWFSQIGCGSLDRQYVQADRGTYNVLSKHCYRWIGADTSLCEGYRSALQALIRSWDFRIAQAESLTIGDK